VSWNALLPRSLGGSDLKRAIDTNVLADRRVKLDIRRTSSPCASAPNEAFEEVIREFQSDTLITSDEPKRPPTRTNGGDIDLSRIRASSDRFGPGERLAT
jgi:hypothetical protein